MSKGPPTIESFNFRLGRGLAGKYIVESFLGSGWEGEVYKVVERSTGIPRAAKVFYPQRNTRDRAVKSYARKLNHLRRCPIVIQYHSSETIWHHGIRITCLISELVEGELLAKLIHRQPGKRLQSFEAMHLLHALASGVEPIHAMREYHGDLHSDNVLITRRGIHFDVRLVDFFHWGPPSAARIRDDVIDLIHILYEAVGGRRRYASQPPEIKSIVRGLRRDLIARSSRTAGHLRRHLESFAWSGR